MHVGWFWRHLYSSMSIYYIFALTRAYPSLPPPFGNANRPVKKMLLPNLHKCFLQVRHGRNIIFKRTGKMSFPNQFSFSMTSQEHYAASASAPPKITVQYLLIPQDASSTQRRSICLSYSERQDVLVGQWMVP